MENPISPSLCPSWRLVYTICSFFAMVAQLWMNNALNFAILCMIKPKDNNPDTLNVDASCTILGKQDCPKPVGFATGEFTWSKHEQWVLLSSYFYGYMIVQPISGRLADKYGGKFFLITGIIGQAILFLLIPAAARIHYWLGMVVRSMQGFLAGFVVTAIYQLFTVWANPSERTTLLALTFSGYATGSLSIFPISSFLCKFGWTIVFYVIGGISLIIGIACNWLIYNKLEEHPWISQKEFEYLKKRNDDKKMVPLIPWKQMFTSVPILAFMATHFFHSYGIIVLNLILPRFLKDCMHFNLIENGYYSSVVHVGGLVSKIIVTFTFDKLYKKSKLNLTKFRRIVYCSGSTVVVFLFLAITALTFKHRMIIVLLIFFIGFSMDIPHTGAYWVSAIDMAPAFAGLVTGISNAAATLTGIVAPQFIAAVVTEGTKGQWNYIYYSMAVSYVLSIVIYGNFGSSERQQWGDYVTKTAETQSE